MPVRTSRQRITAFTSYDHGSVLDDSATVVTLGEDSSATIAGDIGTPGDKDIFTLELTEGKVYLIGASGLGKFT